MGHVVALFSGIISMFVLAILQISCGRIHIYTGCLVPTPTPSVLATGLLESVLYPSFDLLIAPRLSSSYEN
jgi:hypothetical protein